jgi:hypothetical protein
MALLAALVCAVPVARAAQTARGSGAAEVQRPAPKRSPDEAAPVPGVVCVGVGGSGPFGSLGRSGALELALARAAGLDALFLDPAEAVRRVEQHITCGKFASHGRSIS